MKCEGAYCDQCSNVIWEEIWSLTARKREKIRITTNTRLKPRERQDDDNYTRHEEGRARTWLRQWIRLRTRRSCSEAVLGLKKGDENKKKLCGKSGLTLCEDNYWFESMFWNYAGPGVLRKTKDLWFWGKRENCGFEENERIVVMRKTREETWEWDESVDTSNRVSPAIWKFLGMYIVHCTTKDVKGYWVFGNVNHNQPVWILKIIKFFESAYTNRNQGYQGCLQHIINIPKDS